MDLLSHLNPSQRRAVEHSRGPLLVLAGAGSGKTRVITYRIARLIFHAGVSPENILAVTFTNKAAGEMKERIFKLSPPSYPSPLKGEGIREGVPKTVEGLWIGTFHSICLRLLRRHSRIIGYNSDFTVYDKSDQLSLIKECVGELNINEDLYPANSIARRISYLKGRLITPEVFSKRAQGFGMEDKVLKVYRQYQDKLLKNNAMDFDDLIMRCVDLFERDSGILEGYQNQFRHILVDEYQDTNPSQYRLIRLLSERHQNLCVVGDDDQSIYRFRGAELQNILSFERDFPSASVIRLEQNYRSTGAILHIAGTLIEKNAGRREKRLWTEKPSGEPVAYYRAGDEKDEADYVARSIKSMIREGRGPGQFAVLYRTNAQSRVLEEALREAAIPYVIIGGIRFYERREIKDILAYIKASLMPDDDVTIRRIINVPHRGIGASTLERLEEYARTHETSLYEAAFRMAPENPRIGRFVDIMEKLKALVRELPPSGFLKRVFELTGYIGSLEKEGDSEDRIENVMELLGAVGRYEERHSDKGFHGFLDEVSLLSDAEEFSKSGDRNANCVSLMTLHSAKGLEFPVVFITGLEEGILPHIRSMEDEADIEEERRLCYVGMTRARERLCLTSADMRSLYGQSQNKRPSRFLQEIKRDSKLMIEIHSREMYNKEHDDQGMVANARRDRPSALFQGEAVLRPVFRTAGSGERVAAGFSLRPQHGRGNIKQFKAGDRVRHSLWGIGVVESSEGRGDAEKVIVRFHSVGAKTLAVKYANLEVL